MGAGTRRQAMHDGTGELGHIRPNRQMIRCMACQSVLHNACISDGQTARYSNPVKGCNRARGVKTMPRRMHIKGIQHLKAFMRRPFVEIARDDNARPIRNSLCDRAQLAHAMTAHQTKMGRHQTERRQVHTDSAPRLQPWQIDMRHGALPHPLAHQPRIAMPAKAHFILRNRNDIKIGLSSDQLTTQHRRTRPHPAIHLLQGNHIRVQAVQYPQNPHRIAPAIQSNRLADIVTGDAKAFICIRHMAKMGPARPKMKGPTP